MKHLVRWYVERLVQVKYGTFGSMYEMICGPSELDKWNTWFAGTWNAWFRRSMEQMVRCLKIKVFYVNHSGETIGSLVHGTPGSGEVGNIRFDV